MLCNLFGWSGFSSSYPHSCKVLRVILFWIAPYNIWSTPRKWKSFDTGRFLSIFLSQLSVSTLKLFYSQISCTWMMLMVVLFSGKVLEILTQDTTPSSDLLATVKHLYETKLKVLLVTKFFFCFLTKYYFCHFGSHVAYCSLQDVTILIPMLSSLSKNEVCFNFSSFCRLYSLYDC